MSLYQLTPPATEPLSLAEAKHFVRVEHADDDALIAALVVSARAHVETATRRALMTQTWRMVLDAWPAGGLVRVLLAPLQAVEAVRVYEADGSVQQIDSETFVADSSAAPGRIAFPPWAVTAPGRALAGIEIDFVAGYGDDPGDVPEPLRQAIRLLVAHWYEQRGVVAAGSGAQLMPTGVEALLAPYRGLAL
jgi:uncharacterized phiE125 gp8 family phage protein